LKENVNFARVNFSGKKSLHAFNNIGQSKHFPFHILLALDKIYPDNYIHGIIFCHIITLHISEIYFPNFFELQKYILDLKVYMKYVSIKKEYTT